MRRFLPFRDNPTHLQDILEAITNIEVFLTGMNFEGYKADLRTKFAVERQMQVIAEAAVRLGDEADSVAPGPDGKAFGAWVISCGMLTIVSTNCR